MTGAEFAALATRKRLRQIDDIGVIAVSLLNTRYGS
jgi:hypothetical protein